MTRQVSIPIERLQRWLDGFAERHGPFEPSIEDATLHVVGADGAQAWLSMPWLPGTLAPGPALLTRFALLTQQTRRVGVLLVRRGGYATGIFDGDRLVASKVGSSYVQGTTKAGGWSQQRYARRRANQTAAAFAEAADVAVRVLLPEASSLDALVRGGDRQAIGAVLEDPRLGPLATLPSGPILDVPDPRLRVLEATPAQFRTIAITLDP